jgi:hypothetical protein
MVDDQPGDDLTHRLPRDLGGDSLRFEEIVETGPDMWVAISWLRHLPSPFPDCAHRRGVALFAEQFQRADAGFSKVGQIIDDHAPENDCADVAIFAPKPVAHAADLSPGLLGAHGLDLWAESARCLAYDLDAALHRPTGSPISLERRQVGNALDVVRNFVDGIDNVSKPLGARSEGMPVVAVDFGFQPVPYTGAFRHINRHAE